MPAAGNYIMRGTWVTIPSPTHIADSSRIFLMRGRLGALDVLSGQIAKLAYRPLRPRRGQLLRLPLHNHSSLPLFSSTSEDVPYPLNFRSHRTLWTRASLNMASISDIHSDEIGSGTDSKPNLVNRLHESRSPYVSRESVFGLAVPG